ncbi:MAG: hypothetical protein AB7F86_09810 [Bdellovibrionales bacterium]
MSATGSADSFTSQVLENIHYVVLPKTVSEESVFKFRQSFGEWRNLSVEVHVLDFKQVQSICQPFMVAIRAFEAELRRKNMQMISLNISAPVFESIRHGGFESAFNRVQNLAEALSPRREFNPHELRRLLFRYLSQAVFRAVEITFKSTASCDENYSVSAEQVPLSQFDILAFAKVENDFLKAEFRLLATSTVLERLARAMLGPTVQVDQELAEGMALELLNLIYGHAKSHLNDEEGFRLPAVLPSLARQDQISRLKRPEAQDVQIMPVVTPLGSFFVEVDFL